MRKYLLSLCLFCLCIAVKAETPAITLTSANSGDLSFDLAFNAAGPFYIDWGNGTLVPQTATIYLENYSTTSYSVGDIVKIYSSGITVLRARAQNLTSLDVSACSMLIGLECDFNRLTALDVSKNTTLNKLNCNSNEITALDVSKNTALTSLACGTNQLATLDVSKNTALTYLLCITNQLTALDVSKNTALTYLGCTDNKLDTLDVSNNTALVQFYCYANKLTALDISKNLSLEFFSCKKNQLNYTTLPQKKSGYILYGYAPQANIAATVNGVVVDLSSQLTAKDVSGDTQTTSYTWYTQSGTALALGTDYTEAGGLFTFLNIPSDSVYCTMENAAFPAFTGADVLRTVNLKVVPAITLTSANSGDLNFALTFNAAGTFYIDWGDGTLVPQTTTGFYASYSTSSYTVEDTVKVYGSGITVLNVELKNLTSLNVTACTSLNFLACSNNQLKTLDVSNNTALTSLYCYINKIATLELSKNTALSVLNCFDNKFITLNLSNNTALTKLNCTGNKLENLNVSTNTLLTELHCDRNQLSYATLPQKKPGYTNFYYSPQANLAASVTDGVVDLSSQLTAKDVSDATQTTVYTWYTKSGTALTSGIDYNEAGGVFTFLKTPSDSVFCTMENAAFTAFTGADVLRTVNLKVELPSITFTSTNSGDLSFNLVFNAPGTFYIDWGDGILVSQTAYTSSTTYSTASYTKDNTVKIYGSGIKALHVNSKNLTSLNVTSCTTLTELGCYGNQLTALDVSKNTALTRLNCLDNQLIALDVSKNTALTEFYCDFNQLTELDVSKNTALINLGCALNPLKELNIRENLALYNLSCWSTQLTDLDLTKNTMLSVLDCSFNQIDTLYLSNNTALTHLFCYNNKLEYLNVSSNTELVGLYCSNNQLTVLDVRNNTALSELYCPYNQLNYATLPQKKSGYYNFAYVPQANLVASVTNGVVDLSSQLTAKDVSGDNQTTVYTWYTKSGTALTSGIDYNEANGVFTFLKTPSDSVYCTMENAAFPNFTGANVLRTVNLEVIACTNPTNGGEIATDQSGCYPFDPEEITSSALPTGNMGTLEYKWQHSTTSASAGFADIDDSNTATYIPGALTATTWYKRIARVDCMADWAGAAESNVVKITVHPRPKAPVAGANTHIYNGMVRTAIATVGVGETVDWYANATGTTRATAPAGSRVNTYSAYAEARNIATGCVSVVRTLITLDIKHATLTVTADAKTKVYGDKNPTLTFTYSGWVNGPEKINIPPVITTTVEETTNVGIYLNAITVSGGEDNNYIFRYESANFEVTKAMLTVTADATTKVYGATNPALTCSYDGWKNDDNESVLDTIPTASTTVDETATVGEYIGAIISANGADNNYDFNYVAANLTVIKAKLVVTADNQFKEYGDTNPVLTFHYSGWVNGDETIDTPPTIVTTVDKTTEVGSYNNVIEVSGAVDKNYFFEYKAGIFEVTKAVLVVTADDKSKLYGTENPKLTYQYSGWINGIEPIETPPVIGTSINESTAAGTYPNSLIVSEGFDNNYSFQYVSGTMVVEKAILNVIADDKTITYGEAIPELTLSYSGFMNEEDPTVLTALPTIAVSQGEAINAGIYAITVTNGTAKNYSFFYENGKLTVEKAELSVTADNKESVVGVIPALSLTYSGFVKNDSKADIDQLPVATTSALEASSAGTYPISVSGGADNNYTFTYVDGELTLTEKAIALISWTNPAAIIYGSAIGATQLNATANIPGAFTYTPSEGTVLNAGNAHPLTVKFTPTDGKLYAGSEKTVYINVEKAPLTVTADNMIMKVGEEVPELTVVYTGFVNGDKKEDIETKPVATTIATSASGKGDYVIIVTGGADNNYSFVYQNGTLTIESGTAAKIMESVSLKVYPNPFVDKVFISSDYTGEGSYKLIDLNGKTIRSEKMENGNSWLILSQLRSGIYLLQVKLGDEEKSFRLVKQ